MARSIAALLLIAVASAASAQQQDGFSYSYLEAGYAQTDFDDINVDGDGFGLGASVAIADQWHLFASYSGTDLDFGFDATTWAAGIGFNTPISPQMDVVVRASYVSAEIDGPGIGSFDDDGFGLGAGVRVAASEAIELNAGLSYIDTDSGNDTALNAGFLFNINDAFAVGVGGSWDDDVTVLGINGRLYFE